MSTEPIALTVVYTGDIIESAVHEIVVACMTPDTDVLRWEFSIRWVALHDDHRPPSVQVRAWDDAWRAFVEMPEFFQWLAAQHGTSPGLATVAANLAIVAKAGIQFTGYWPEGCGVTGDKRPEPPPHPPEHAPAYERVARWVGLGSPIPEPYTCSSDYARDGLPGWEG